MKNFVKFIGFIAVTAIITFIACEEIDIGGGSTATYTGTAADGTRYTLIITQAARAITPAEGDSYELTVGVKRSTGTVQDVTGSKLTLKPRTSGAETFTATVSGENGLTNVTGLITFDDDTSQQGPGELEFVTPPPGGVYTSGDWTLVTDSTFGTNGIGDIAYGGGTFVAIYYTSLAYSFDGVKWTAITGVGFGGNTFTASIQAITYGGGTFIAVGGNAKIATSPDGMSWTTARSITGTAFTINHIAYGGNKWVAAAYSATYGVGEIMYSDDNGATWQSVSGFEFDVGDIAYGDGKFVAVNGGTIAYSTDGANWVTKDVSNIGSISGIFYANNRFVGWGSNSKTAYSTDGISWTAAANAPFSIRAVAYGNGRFVAVGDSGQIAYSTDGASWAAIADSSIWDYQSSGETRKADITGVAYGNNRFVVVGRQGKVAYADWDGSSGVTAPTIITASLPVGAVGIPYSQTLGATGSTPVTWSIDSGALPAGLNLSTAGVISGTVATAGTSSFTVKAANAKGSVTKQLSIVMNDPIPLTENQWADGNITTAGGNQWFSFTAAASTQYIHVEHGTLADLYVNVYTGSGTEVGSETNLYSFSSSKLLNTSRTLTVGQKYYIRVRPFYTSGSNSSGTYRIGFTASTTAPITLPSNPIQLTDNQWADGDIPTAGGEQWFRFTATASTQYIYVAAGTLELPLVQVYTSSGAAVGSETFSSTQSLTLGQTYYIRVRAYGSYSGTYRIGFNTSTTAPAN